MVCINRPLAGVIWIILKISSLATSATRSHEPEQLLADSGPLTVDSLPKPAARPVAGNSLSHSYRQGLNERYTFENFIVGSGNELAFAACQAIAGQPGTKYNPLFLYGGVGIGKTHRLRSRFAGGMSIDMQIPDFETRCAIVQTKAQAHEIELDREIVEYLATNIQTNIRELEGALNQLLAFCEMRGLEPTLGVATSLLSVSKTRPKHLSAKQIIERTARHFQIPVDDIVGPKRDKDIVVPRQIAMYILRSELHLSFPKIARELGRKDHTTAIHSVEKIEKESRLDASMRMAISEIKELLYA
jgi:chromosomal replication initiation ATPase DnaA